MIRLAFYLLLIIVVVSCSKNSDSTDSTSTINPTINITSNPVEVIDHNREYVYQIQLTSSDNSEVTLEVNAPTWLNYDTTTNTISGIAGWDNVNQNFAIGITATNASGSIDHSYNLTVNLGEIICDQPFGNPIESEYILPYNIDEEYEIIQSYCPSNPNWGHNNWFAYDFEMGIGEAEIIASRSGIILAIKQNNPDVSDCSGGKENYVFITHSDGTVMSYVHLKQNSIVVNVGENVEQGQTIGLSGNSGCSSGPHTHIALFKDNTNFDRQSTIPFNYSNAQGTLDNNNGLVQGENYKAL